MLQNTVLLTVKTGLCCSCGGCKNQCPKEAISWKLEKGIYVPEIDSEKCIKCGLCLKVCPGIQMSYECHEDMIKTMYGKYIDCYNAWSKDKTIRHISASGGVITSVINYLLKNGFYDVAFCVDTYDYKVQLKTSPITKDDLMSDWENSSIPKSRYIPVSNENAILYIKQNKDKKVILIGTSCAIRMFRKVISSSNLSECNYLLFGLFCDRVFNYNIEKYFEDNLCNGRTISHFHFKNKESGGWPGNMKFYLDDGGILYKDKSERTRIKDYFMPERCMYCIDKLDVCADISVGDNYTDQNSDVLGSNTVIIRTNQGLEAWNKAKEVLKYERIDIEKLRKAQYLEGRLNNIYYAELKEQQIRKRFGVEVCLNKNLASPGNMFEYDWAWKNHLRTIKMGEKYCEEPKKLLNNLQKGRYTIRCLNRFARVISRVNLTLRKMIMKYR